MRRGSGILITIAAAASTAALAQAPKVDPKATVEAVAARIEQNYYDVARAKRIAAGLRADAAKYERLTDPHDLANALTDRLKEEDRHFAVSWVGHAGPSPTPEHAHVGPDPEVAARRSGYGFRRVEILPGNIGYIDMRSFEPIDFARRDWPVWVAADGVLAMVAKTDAVIIDVRNNGGGAPTHVGYI